MAFIQVDVERVRATVVAAEAALADAEQAQNEAARKVVQARSELDFARRVEQAVLNAAVQPVSPPLGEPSSGEPPGVSDVAAGAAQDHGFVATVATGKKRQRKVVSLPADLLQPEIDLRSLSTRDAVMLTLRTHQGYVFPLDVLVQLMSAHGFKGSHNAVHVQLSRLIGTSEAADIERVKTGHYRAVPAPAVIDDPLSLMFSGGPQPKVPNPVELYTVEDDPYAYSDEREETT